MHPFTVVPKSITEPCGSTFILFNPPFYGRIISFYENWTRTYQKEIQVIVKLVDISDLFKWVGFGILCYSFANIQCIITHYLISVAKIESFKLDPHEKNHSLWNLIFEFKSKWEPEWTKITFPTPMTIQMISSRRRQGRQTPGLIFNQGCNKKSLELWSPTEMVNL